MTYDQLLAQGERLIQVLCSGELAKGEQNESSVSDDHSPF